MADGMANKLPWFQFFASDWLANANLRRCSLAARGMWADMLCLMHECEERGVLISGNVPWSDEDVAAAVGGDTTANLTVLRELLEKRVAKRDNRNAIYSSRMVRDEAKRRKCAEAGKRGGGNPVLTYKGRAKGLPKVVPKVTSNVPSDSGLMTSEGGSTPEGVQGEPPPRGECAPAARPPPAPHEVIPDDVLDLFTEWTRRGIPGPYQTCQLAERIEKYGVDLVRRGLRQNLKRPAETWHFNYLDRILDGGAHEKPEPKGIDLDEIDRLEGRR